MTSKRVSDYTCSDYSTKPLFCGNFIFISYDNIDAESAKRLKADLVSKGLNPWDAKDIILPGQNWEDGIRRGIKNSSFFIPLFSSNSVNRTLSYMNKELKYALDIVYSIPENRRFVIPVRLDDCQIPVKLRDIQYVNLFPDWNTGLNQILKAIKTTQQ